MIYTTFYTWFQKVRAPLIFSVSMSPLCALAQGPNFNWFATFFGLLKNTLQLLVPVLVILALVLFLWGVVVFIFNAGDEKARGEGKKRILWGLIGLFVIVTVWGLVQLLSQLTGIFAYTGINPPQALFTTGG